MRLWYVTEGVELVGAELGFAALCWETLGVLLHRLLTAAEQETQNKRSGQTGTGRIR
jgi:hypothetical protein